ncbi:ribonuclease HIII [Hutsoniella sourekii]|uniref:ribonuclease HIII n=1 Tax=Hutsoniella sourekii TaxID=87650 RepID=UPI000489C51B|nr:ribonuclease HIII [Hutsoniella sourekii]
MTSITLNCSKDTIQKMESHYQDHLTSPVPYSHFRAKQAGVTITAYQSGKVLFQGQGASEEANKWQEASLTPSPSKKESQASSSLPEGFATWTIIGNDEVGNGSYFGPLTVCSVYLPQDQLALIQELGVKDSKSLSDDQIRDLAWQIKACLPYHLTVCQPKDYNRAIESGYNAVSIKVSLHNFTIQKLLAKLDHDQKDKLQACLIDQFTPAGNYYKYLKQEKHPYTKNLYFIKKGESAHLAVAAASIIARAAFLESLEELGQPYGQTLPSGAGPAVDQFGAKLARREGFGVLSDLAKLHFKNTSKIKKLI